MNQHSIYPEVDDSPRPKPERAPAAKRKKRNERLKQWLDFWRFILGTAGLSVLTLLLGHVLKEREVALKESEAKTERLIKEHENLGKYLQYALSENMEARRRFAEYFSYLTSDLEARQRWKDYSMLLDTQLAKSEELAKQKAELVARLEKTTEPNQEAELRGQVARIEAESARFEPLPGIQFKRSAELRAIELIIVSETESVDPESTLRILQSSRATGSYHFLVAPNGTCQKIVDENDVAYHTRGFNDNSIGIGLLHRAGSPFGQQQIDGLVSLLVNTARKYGVSPAQIKAKSEILADRRTDIQTHMNDIRSRVEQQLRNE